MSAKSTCSILANASIVLDTSCSTYAGRFPVVPHRTLEPLVSTTALTASVQVRTSRNIRGAEVKACASEED